MSPGCQQSARRQLSDTTANVDSVLGKIFQTKRQRINAVVALFLNIAVTGGALWYWDANQNVCDKNEYSSECVEYQKQNPEYVTPYCREHPDAYTCLGASQ